MASSNDTPADVGTTAPEGRTNNIDWNNVITGEKADVVNLHIDRLPDGGNSHYTNSQTK